MNSYIFAAECIELFVCQQSGCLSMFEVSVVLFVLWKVTDKIFFVVFFPTNYQLQCNFA